VSTETSCGAGKREYLRAKIESKKKNKASKWLFEVLLSVRGLAGAVGNENGSKITFIFEDRRQVEERNRVRR